MSPLFILIYEVLPRVLHWSRPTIYHKRGLLTEMLHGVWFELILYHTINIPTRRGSLKLWSVQGSIEANFLRTNFIIAHLRDRHYFESLGAKLQGRHTFDTVAMQLFTVGTILRNTLGGIEKWRRPKNLFTSEIFTKIFLIVELLLGIAVCFESGVQSLRWT